jgi:hypothetical protein
MFTLSRIGGILGVISIVFVGWYLVVALAVSIVQGL